jgi:hypothetical protein
MLRCLLSLLMQKVLPKHIVRSIYINVTEVLEKRNWVMAKKNSTFQNVSWFGIFETYQPIVP